MKFRVGLIKLIIGALSFHSVTSFAGHDGGNGGHPYEIEFFNLGIRWLEILYDNPQTVEDLLKTEDFEKALNSTYLKVVKEVWVLDNQSTSTRKAAKNIPEKKQIEIDLELWPKLRSIEKRNIVLHEYLGILKIEENHYRVSDEIIRKLGSKFESGLTKKTKVELLEQYHVEADKVGYDYVGAKRICEQATRNYSKSYFLVECEYIYKQWSEEEYHYEVETWYQYVGNTRTNLYSYAEASSSIQSSYFWGAYKRRQNLTAIASSSASISIPIFLQRSRPIQMIETVNYGVYGLRIYGIPFSNGIRRLYPTQDMLEQARHLEFSVNTESRYVAALANCKKLLFKLQERMSEDNFDYQKSWCQIKQLDKNKYSYEILSMNPYLGDKDETLF